MWNHEIKCCRKRLSLLVNCLATVKNHSDIFHQSKQCVIVKLVRFSGSLLMFILPAHSLNHQSPKLIVAFYLWLIILFRNRWIKVHHHRHHFVYCLYFTQMWHAHTHPHIHTDKKWTDCFHCVKYNLFVCVFWLLKSNNVTTASTRNPNKFFQEQTKQPKKRMATWLQQQ